MADDEIVMQGANARAAGLTRFDNPFYRVDAMPRQTGETHDAWMSKVDRWTLGWTAEDAVRS